MCQPDCKDLPPPPGIHALVNPTPLNVGRTCDLLLTNRIRQRQWHTCDYMSLWLHYIRFNVHLARRLDLPCWL